MKKYLLFILAVLLLCFSSAGAQDAELNLLTVGDLFRWSDSKQDVTDVLDQIDGWTVNEDSSNSGTISVSAQKETDEKQSFFYFYFDAASGVLKEVECADIFFSDEAPLSYAEDVIVAYDLDSVDFYEDGITAEYTANLDGYMTVAGDETICILGGNDPTDEYYGFLTLVFFNRAFN